MYQRLQTFSQNSEHRLGMHRWPSSVASDLFLPAEWAPQAGVLIAWPHNNSDWAGQLESIEQVYLEVSKQIASSERLLVICHDNRHKKRVNELLLGYGVDSEAVVYIRAKSNDTWTRDYGPITVSHRGRPILRNFHFNGWGRLYPADLDNSINPHLHRKGVFGRVPMTHCNMVLEGGNIDSDGQNSLLAKPQCFWDPNRNPDLDLDAIEAILRIELGVNKILWLKHGFLAGDDTGGHIDNLARFCNEETIAYCACERREDEHYSTLKAMEKELQSFRTAQGKPYKLVPLPLPSPIYNDNRQRLPASYVNFLISNDAVLVPKYNDVADDIAIHRFGEIFKGRRIVGIDCIHLIQQYGGLHCMTMHFPSGIEFTHENWANPAFLRQGLRRQYRDQPSRRA